MAVAVVIAARPRTSAVEKWPWRASRDDLLSVSPARTSVTLLQREPRPLPKLKILRKVENIDDFRAEDFNVEDYNPHATIKMEMSL